MVTMRRVIKTKVGAIQGALEKAFPDKTPTAIKIMLNAWEVIKTELAKKKDEEILKIIKESNEQ